MRSRSKLGMGGLAGCIYHGRGGELYVRTSHVAKKDSIIGAAAVESGIGVVDPVRHLEEKRCVEHSEIDVGVG